MNKILISVGSVMCVVALGFGVIKVKANLDKVNRVNEVVKTETVKLMQEYGLQNTLDSDVHTVIKDARITDILSDEDVNILVDAVAESVNRLRVGTVTQNDLVKVQEKIGKIVQNRTNGLSDEDINSITDNLQTIVLSAIDGEYANTNTTNTLANKITLLQQSVDYKNQQLQKAINSNDSDLQAIVQQYNSYVSNLNSLLNSVKTTSSADVSELEKIVTYNKIATDDEIDAVKKKIDSVIAQLEESTGNDLSSVKESLLTIIEANKNNSTLTISELEEALSKEIDELETTSELDLGAMKEQLLSKIEENDNKQSEKGILLSSSINELDKSITDLQLNMDGTTTTLKKMIGNVDDKQTKSLTQLNEDLIASINKAASDQAIDLDSAKEVLNNLITENKDNVEYSITHLEIDLNKAIDDIEVNTGRDLSSTRDELTEIINKYKDDLTASVESVGAEITELSGSVNTSLSDLKSDINNIAENNAKTIYDPVTKTLTIFK